MSNPYRFLSLGLFAAFGATMVGQFVSPTPQHVEEPVEVTLLAKAHANPAEIAYADTLRRGETFSQLLLRTRLADDDAKLLLSELEQHQDPRRLRAGSILSYRTGYLNGAARAIELRLDADRTLNAKREGESWKVEVEQVPVQTDTVVLAGSIQSSLYASLARGRNFDIPTEERERIVDILTERIFAWQIDFARDLRPGDEFRVVYERLARPDGTSRASRVLGVQLSVNGREHEAYFFRAPDGSEDYYGRNGESMKRAFLRAPLEFRRISSVFNNNRLHPITGQRRPHQGVDYAAATGTPVRAVADGVIGRAGWGGGYGNVIDIRHSRGYSTRYAHLNGFAKGIKAGTRVRQGDLIGYVGSTGMSTGPHLHYEFHLNGRPVDPNSLKYLTGEPVPARHRTAFQRAVNAQLALIERSESSTRLASAAAGASAAEEN